MYHSGTATVVDSDEELNNVKLDKVSGHIYLILLSYLHVF